MSNPTMYVNVITPEQAAHFEQLLREQNWELDTVPYARFRAKKEKTTVVAYDSGKLVIQGKGTADVVQFTLEPQVLKEVRFGYEDVLGLAEAEETDPEMLKPHAGIDESGKGDFFGPLVIACAYVDEVSAKRLIAAGVQDSKAIKSDKRMAALAAEVRKATAGRYSIVAIGPEAYNRMYDKFKNLNRMLAWGHARALENLLERVPDCPRAISDQFGRKETVVRALGERGKRITLEQMPKAEADVAVAAASILARHEFVERMNKLGEVFQGTLPKGASGAVRQRGEEIFAAHGNDGLRKCAKLHFRTAYLIRGEEPPERKPFRR